MFDTGGCDPDKAEYGVILLHGRGSDGSDMHPVFTSLYLRQSFALFPHAPFEIMQGRLAWYTKFWNDDPDHNLAEMSQSFTVVEKCLDEFKRHNIPEENLILIGHSQGANLMLEFVVDNPRPFKAVVAMRGCFLGNLDVEREFTGDLNGIKFILNSGRKDPYIPIKKIDQTSELIQQLGGDVFYRNYDTAHGICQAELRDLRKLFHKNFDYSVLAEE